MSAAPFISDDKTGVYFWTSGDAQLSSHPHPLLPIHCEFHGWWSDKECAATHGPRRRMAEIPNEPRKRRGLTARESRLGQTTLQLFGG
jgi:hypothetical protein